MDKRRDASLEHVTATAEKRIGSRQFNPVTVIPQAHELAPGVLHGIAWVGTYSLTDARTIYIDKRKGWEHNGIWWTPGGMARDYLKAFNFKASRGFYEQYDVLRYRPQALLAKPGHYEDMAYVDLTAAYWSILSVTGWGVDYWPNRYIMVRDDVTDYPLATHKQARNALVGVAVLRGKTRVFWRGGYQWRSIGNRYQNAHLWAWLQDVLHSVAWFAVEECNAVYVNTDGYIMPRADADRMLDYLSWVGLTGRVHAEGDARIHGVGAYSIGGKKTHRPVVTDKYHFNLNPDVRGGWVMERFRKFAQKRS